MSMLSEKDNLLQAFIEKLEKNSLLNIPTDVFIAEVRSHVEDFKEPLPGLGDISNFLQILIDASKSISPKLLYYSVGTVQYIGNGVATLSGLPDASLEELVNFPNGVQGMVLSLDQKYVDVLLLGSDLGIQGGDLAEATGQRLNIPVGFQFLGRVIDPLGNPLMNDTPIVPSEYRPVEKVAPGVTERAPVDTPLYTGTKIIDALFPLGRGQRELIVGDRQIGKTTLALDTILQQRETNVACIYVSIGQKKASVIDALDILEKGGVMPQTTVIVASPDDPPALRYLAPYSGVTLAEFFMDSGRDVLIVYDDLSKHADTYREISLLLRRPPGREAYPGDIFYLHSRLLERACRLNEDHGGKSITALPIVTTQRGNISSYIVTNLISITDGQIILDTDLFNRADLPAIDVGKSVSRVGSAAQEPAMKKVAGALKLELSQYEEVAHFARFGTDVGELTRRQIERGRKLHKLLNQGPNQPVGVIDQTLMFYAFTHSFLEQVPEEDIPEFIEEMLEELRDKAPRALDELSFKRDFSETIETQINQVLTQFVSEWAEKRTQTS